MGHHWTAGIAPFALAVGLAGGVCAGDTSSDPTAGGVLDQLSVPGVPMAAGSDGHSVLPPMATDPIAVPTPTAAEFGGVVLVGMIGWRATRRAVGRA